MSKVVLITGGSSGIGKATGELLTSKGFIVYGTTRNLAKYPNFNAFELVKLDVRDDETVQKAVNYVVHKAGRIDVLINNAGVGIFGPIEETPISAINNAFDINFNGPIRLIQAVLPHMREQNSGLIINITSIAGYMGLPFRGIYSSTKGALELLTEALNMEVKDFGIEITNIAPGDFATNIASGRYQVPVNESSAYHNKYSPMVSLMNEHVDSGDDPAVVAEKILEIISKDKLKLHYKVGPFTQRLSLLLKKTLPDKMYEKLLLKHYKL